MNWNQRRPYIQMVSTEPLTNFSSLKIILVLQDKHISHEAPEDHSSILKHHPDVVEHSNDGHEQTSERKADEGQNEAHEQDSNVHLVEAEQNVQEDAEADAEGDDDVEGYEDVESGEYVDYEQYDDSKGDAAEETYEDGEGEYAGEEREGEEVGYENADALYSLESGEKQADDLDETQTLPDEAVQSRSLLPDDANDSEATGEALGKSLSSGHWQLRLTVGPLPRTHSAIWGTRTIRC